MNWRSYLILYLAALSILWLVSSLQTAPGYMDAEYYYAGGEQLAEGRGFTEPYIWNFLDEPQALPRPSHAYWMPLASILAAAGMRLFGSDAFAAARIPFLLAAALLAPLTAGLTWRLTSKAWHAWLAGLLAILPGFYLPYLTTTDTFGIYAVLGAGWFLTLARVGLASGQPRGAPQWISWVMAGCIAGGMHLARADGVVWLFLCFAAAFRFSIRTSHRVDFKQFGVLCLSLLAGYVLIMGGWYWRNLAVFGTPLSPGAARAMWILDYDELYIYPASLLTPGRWWSAGLPALIAMRANALWQNVQSLLVVQGQIFLAPLMAMGLWKLRHHVIVQLGLLSEVLTLAVMTLVFPLAGWRGGYFHSGIAMQALLWAVVPTGLEAFVEWGRRVRNWNPTQAIPVFRTGLVALAVMLSILSVSRRVVGDAENGFAWNSGNRSYQEIESRLRAAGATEVAIVLVNNPPGYYAATRRMAIAIPSGDEDTAWLAARNFGVTFLILEANHPGAMDALYNQPQSSRKWNYLAEYEGTFIYEIRQP